MSSSSSSSFQLLKTYDAYISFRDSDVGNEFLSHLLDALDRNKIDVFVYDNLERGEEITKSLLEKIEDSYISVVIFSENYAYSSQCLNELVKILECKKTLRQPVIPVFYQVDQTHVQQLTGRYGDALVHHRQEVEESLVKSWGDALKEIAELSGLVSQNIKPDSRLIEEIVKHILEKLSQMFSNECYNKELVGIDSRVNYVESLLCLESPKVCVVGIWGIGGIGKTTIANKVFDRIKDRFPSQCFFSNVRQRLEKSVPDSLQNEILCTLLGKKVSSAGSCFMSSSFIRRRLARKKVLIVLDDVYDLEQVELLIGKRDIYGPGSRIIITSRDKQLLRNLNAEIYEVEALNDNEARCLFRLHAFKQTIPKREHKPLIERAVLYSQGIPLALKVLASNLYNRSIEEWEDEMEKLKDTSDEKIGKILRISYDRLCKIDKEIFLDIACFFIGEDKDHVLALLDRTGSKIGISHLCDKSLITISENKLHMHGLLQQMAKDITCEEEQLGMRRILWHHKDLCDLFPNDEGTGANKGISLDTSKIRDIQLKPTAFERLYNLRYLKIYNPCIEFIPEGQKDMKPESIIKVHFPGRFTLLPNELRLLQWDGYPSKSLPSNSYLENLVELRMPRSRVIELWSGAQQHGNLKLIDLSYSTELTRLPDFSKTSNVEILNLEHCANLQNLEENIGNLKCLLSIHLTGTAIEELPESICNLKYLRHLYIENCRNLRRLPDKIGNLECLEELRPNGTRIKQLPSSFIQLQKLSSISFDECEGFIFPPLPNVFHCVTIIGLAFCGLSEFPSSLCSMLSLEALYIGGNNFESIPETIKQLSKLDQLDLRDCKRLKYLPEIPSQTLHYLCVGNCISLTSAFTSFELLQKQQKLIQLGFGNCINLDREEYDQIVEHTIAIAEKDEFLCKHNRKIRLRIPGSEVPRKMMYQNKTGSSLRLSSKPVKEMDLYFCAVFAPSSFHQKCDNFLRIGCEAIFTDESGQMDNAATYYYCDSTDYYYSADIGIAMDSEHVFFWRGRLKFKLTEEEEIGDPCTIQFHFFGNLGAVTGCGIHPLSNHISFNFSPAEF